MKTFPVKARRPVRKINGNMRQARFKIIGISPLVVHRFSARLLDPKPLDLETRYNEARYQHKDGWDGFNAATVRGALIVAGYFDGFKITDAKWPLFVIADGTSKGEPQYDLVRIYGTRHRLRCGPPSKSAYLPMYFPWRAFLRISFDADRFSLTALTGLIRRAGLQGSLCEGRYANSKTVGPRFGRFKLAEDLSARTIT